MQITFYSVSMTVIWSCLLILLICLLRKKYLSIPFFGVSGMVLLYLLCMIRMILPVEIPFARIVNSRHLYNRMVLFFNLNKQAEMTDIRVGTLIASIWLIGVAVSITRYVYHYYHSIKEIKTFEKREDLKIQAVMEEIILEKGKNIKPIVLLSPTVRVPMSIGIVKKFILLPDKEYRRQDLYYILKHEYMHLVHGDLLIKMLVQLICCFYWWNPFVHWLRKGLEQTLEIKCDLAVIRNMEDEEKADYLSVIVSAIKDAKCGKEYKGKDRETGYVHLFSEKFTNVKERFEIVSGYKGIRNENTAKNGMFAVFLAVLLFSYTFVIQSEFEAPMEEIEEKEGAYSLDISENYIIRDKDGAYKISLPNGGSNDVDEETALKLQAVGFQISDEGVN